MNKKFSGSFMLNISSQEDARLNENTFLNDAEPDLDHAADLCRQVAARRFATAIN